MDILNVFAHFSIFIGGVGLGIFLNDYLRSQEKT